MKKMENRKSFLIITNELPIDNSGGANIRNFHLVKELSKYYDITLLTTFPNKNNIKYLKDFEDICEVVTINSLFNNFFYKKIILKRGLKKILKTKKFDYIQVEHSEFGNILQGIKNNSIKKLVEVIKNNIFLLAWLW